MVIVMNYRQLLGTMDVGGRFMSTKRIKGRHKLGLIDNQQITGKFANWPLLSKMSMILITKTSNKRVRIHGTGRAIFIKPWQHRKEVHLVMMVRALIKRLHSRIQKEMV